MRRAAPRAGRASLYEARRSVSEPRRRLLQKCAKVPLYLFVVLLTGILGRLYKEFCNSLRRRPLQKCAKALFYSFAVLLTGILGRLEREFCNSLRSSPPPSAARGYAQKKPKEFLSGDGGGVSPAAYAPASDKRYPVLSYSGQK